MSNDYFKPFYKPNLDTNHHKNYINQLPRQTASEIDLLIPFSYKIVKKILW